jgi:hypothetical protein
VLAQYHSTEPRPVPGSPQVLFDGTDFIVFGTYRVRADGSFITQDSFCYVDNNAISNGVVMSAQHFIQVFACFSTPSGGVAGPGAVTLAPSANYVTPAVASGAGMFLVVFQSEDNHARAVRLEPSGAVSDSTPIDVASDAGWPLVASFDGANFMMAFTRH